ncbi:MAG: DUF1636 domain-containing protein [Parvularculaceae bacterium]
MNETQSSIVHLTVCATCLDTSKSGDEGVNGGGVLYGMIENVLETHPYRDRIELIPQRCLMACSNGCVASVASEGKMQYLLGRMPAENDVAAQLVDFAAMYADAPTGVTANHEWPDKLAMFFLGRIPPVNPVDADWAEDGCNL